MDRILGILTFAFLELVYFACNAEGWGGYERSVALPMKQPRLVARHCESRSVCRTNPTESDEISATQREVESFHQSRSDRQPIPPPKPDNGRLPLGQAAPAASQIH